MGKRVAALALIVVAGWSSLGQTTKYPQYADEARQTCYEDEPCWRCDTMGNRQCGPERRVIA